MRAIQRSFPFRTRPSFLGTTELYSQPIFIFLRRSERDDPVSHSIDLSFQSCRGWGERKRDEGTHVWSTVASIRGNPSARHHSMNLIPLGRFLLRPKRGQADSVTRSINAQVLLGVVRADGTRVRSAMASIRSNPILSQCSRYFPVLRYKSVFCMRPLLSSARRCRVRPPRRPTS